MTCHRCAGFVIPYRDTTLGIDPVYCVNCGWYGERWMLTETDIGALESVLAQHPKRRGPGRPPLTDAERARKSAHDYVPDPDEMAFREKMSLVVRSVHARKGHRLSLPSPAALLDDSRSSA